MSGPRPVIVCHPGSELYGSDRVVLETVTGLLADGREVVVVVPGDGPLVSELRARGAEVVLCRMPVVRKSILRPAGSAAFVRDSVVGWRQGRRLLKRVRPGLVFVNTVTIPFWLALSRTAGIASVCHVHEGEASAGRLLRAGLAAPLLLASTVIANSRFSVDVLKSSFRRLAGTEIVHNAVPGPETKFRARNSVSDALRVVYVGRLSPRKGVDVAVDAVSQLIRSGTPATLSLVGSVFPGYEWYEAELRAKVASSGLTDSVRFLGFVNPVWDAISEADVLVVPSRADEPFGNTAVEGILAARPVIASATSGLLEATNGYGAARTVHADDVGALTDALAAVAREWDSLRETAWTDSRIAEDRHSPTAYHRAIVNVVERTEAAHAR